MGMSDKLIQIIQNRKTQPTLQRDSNSSWLNLLEEMANQPAQQEESMNDFAPMSPDPRFNHKSKIVPGLPMEIKQSEEELEQERARLRKQYLGNRAETVLFESKHGEITPINYNEYC